MKKEDESTSSLDLDSPAQSIRTLRWVLKKEIVTADGVRIIVRKAVEQSEAVTYIVKTPDGRRFVFQRTNRMVMLMSSDESGTTRFITCNLKS